LKAALALNGDETNRQHQHDNAGSLLARAPSAAGPKRLGVDHFGDEAFKLHRGISGGSYAGP